MIRLFATVLATCLALTALCAGQALAQPAPQASPQAPVTPEEQLRRAGELRRLEGAMSLSAEARRRLETEIDAIRNDRARLAEALVAAAERGRAIEDGVRSTEGRLQTLNGAEAAIRRSLDARRGVIIEVLAALQRMGRRPPPAILTRPEDVLAALRSSMLLGAVVPELRAEASTLATDLGELVRLRDAIALEAERLKGELASLGLERERLAGLVSARQAALVQAERGIGAERDRAADLAGQARTLRELIERMEREIGSAEKAAEEAKQAAELQTRETRERFAAAAFRDPARLSPKIPFQEARGVLPKPVSGEVAREFGAPDGAGGTTRGILLAARPGSAVSSPADGWVAFAGPFRSYGRLLIINAGGGYYLLLAGMDRINVEVGQFVLAGEPVATMGESSSGSAAAGAIEISAPVLYVEFRKDGGSIDPGPWWAKSQSEKVRG